MFQRRHQLPIHHRIRAVVWPSRGWRRASLYIAHRLRRLPGTPYRVAAGFACGAAISFTPFLGFHFLGAALLSVALRGNLMASAIGTVVGNPWTFPFIWTWTFAFGQFLMSGEPASDLPAVLGFSYIFDRPLEVLWPMTVGGVPTAIVVWFGFFFPVRGAVAEYQHARNRRIRRKMRTESAGRREQTRAVASSDKELDQT